MLIYDGDCGFCQWSLGWALRLGVTCEHRPAHAVDLAAYDLTFDDVIEAAWFVEGDRRLRGHEAIAATLRTSRHAPVRWLGAFVGSRAARPLAVPVYAWVARNRHRLPGASDACGLPPRDAA
ncbi:thiol-disulfide oxidoreductase DCC family protein [Nocardioides guangzhouensis]|nr:DCC1-like thiol-disulfide oxidoreductase family protein [Nocardioides guangzhouensis]